MSKLDNIKQIIDKIINTESIKSLFTKKSINDSINSIIDLYIIVDKDQIKDAYQSINKIVSSYDYLLYTKNSKFNNYYKSNYYFENSLLINVYYMFNLEFKIYEEIQVLYDPYKILDSLIISKLPYTNLEYAKKIDEFSVLLYDFYNSYLEDDKILSYNIALKIHNLFILIYRGFYDSLNAKKEYKELNKSMSKNNYNKLFNYIKQFRYDNFFDLVREYIKEINYIVDKLPINLITLFNIDFYTFTKQLIYNL